MAPFFLSREERKNGKKKKLPPRCGKEGVEWSGLDDRKGRGTGEEMSLPERGFFLPSFSLPGDF